MFIYQAKVSEVTTIRSTTGHVRILESKETKLNFHKSKRDALDAVISMYDRLLERTIGEGENVAVTIDYYGNGRLKATIIVDGERTDITAKVKKIFVF